VTEPATAAAAPVWKRVLAVILDFFTAFFVFGMAVAYVSGDTTSTGFNLDGLPALVLFALMAAYFFVGRRCLGGTLWDHILRIGRPQPKT
jgi:hypothetical protein